MEFSKQQKIDLKRAAKMLTQDSAKRFLQRISYERLNHRRSDLIIKRSLTEEDKIEFNILQKEISRLINLAYPLPKIDDDELIALLEKNSF